VANHKKHTPPALAKRGRSALRGVGINGGKPQNMERLGQEA